jgi:putative ABC transport system permease protein
MLKNYFKVGYRNLVKNPAYSFINIFGLAVGFFCCLLILVYLFHEFSYDSYHRQIDQLYQLGTRVRTGEKQETQASTPAPMGPAMKREFPEIQETARLFMFSLFGESKNLFQYTQPDGQIQSLYETHGFLADPSFFRLFNYDFVEGDPATALNEPNSLVLSKDIAKKIFGDQPALNKIIHISSYLNRDQNCVVRGVFRPGNQPSHIDGRFFISIYGGDMEQSMKGNENNMVNNNFYFTYLLLQPGTDPNKLASKFPAFIEKYAGKDLRAAGFSKSEFLIPVRSIHLQKELSADITPTANTSYLYMLGSVAAFILLIACINFMNLSTARSSRRSAEIGVRKVLGAQRISLVLQFLGESLLLTLAALVLAAGLFWIALPDFERMSGRNLSLPTSSYALLFGLFFIAGTITGLLGGFYPAFYLSSFQPVKILKGKFIHSLSALSIRKGLVVFQFVISFVLIIASVIIYRQMQFLRSADLGFAKDRQIIIPILSDEAIHQYGSLKNEISKNPRVLSVAGCYYYPGIFFNSLNNRMRRETQGPQEDLEVKMNWVDAHYLKTLEIEPVAGRLFSPEFPSDTLNHVILNEEAVKKLGFASPQQAIGQRVFRELRGESTLNEVIGVVKDFHFQDLHVPIAPFAFYLNNSGFFSYLIVHADKGEMGPVLKSIQSSWRRIDPAEPFSYSFLDDDFQKNYEPDNQLASIVNRFTMIAILISCLGLFGLANFSVEQRAREIGIRKILGASIPGIIGLLSKDFLRLVAMAILVASPLGYWIMNQWLQGFAYRIAASWFLFAFAAIMTLTIAFTTILFQAIKAATTNPVVTLKTE